MLIKDSLLKYWDEFEKRVENPQDISGISTKMPKLDRETDGLCAGDFWIIGADSGIGKTTFAFNLALDLCAQGYSCCYWVTEMSQLRCIERILSMRSGIDYFTIRHPKRITDDQKTLLYEISNTISRYTLDLMAGISFLSDDVCDYVRNNEIHFDVVFIDHLQQCKEAQGADFVAGLQNASFNFQDLAKEHNTCVVGLSQISKEGQKTGKISRWQLKGSSALVQSADYVILMNRDADSEDKAQKMLLEVIIDKARYGSTGKFECTFNLETGKIKEREVYHGSKNTERKDIHS